MLEAQVIGRMAVVSKPLQKGGSDTSGTVTKSIVVRS